jgi:hypothetical protein
LGDRRILAVAAVIALLFIWIVPGFAEPQTSGGVYKVTMRNPGTMGVVSDCSTEGYVLARGDESNLQSDGSLLGADGQPGPHLFLRLLTDVSWTRKYDVGKGLSGVFNGCFGETFGANGYSGNLFISFAKRKGVPTVSFIWHFDYYLTPPNTMREHFTMITDPIPFPAAWTGGKISGRVTGTFDLQYYLTGNKYRTGYESLTGGVGRYFEFDLVIEKLQ